MVKGVYGSDQMAGGKESTLLVTIWARARLFVGAYTEKPKVKCVPK